MKQRAVSLALLLLVAAAAVSVHASRTLQQGGGNAPALPRGGAKYREGRVRATGGGAACRGGAQGCGMGAQPAGGQARPSTLVHPGPPLPRPSTHPLAHLPARCSPPMHQVLVIFEAGADQDAAYRAVKRAGRQAKRRDRLARRHDGGEVVAADLPAGLGVDEAVAAFRRQRGVVRAEPDFVVYKARVGGGWELRQQGRGWRAACAGGEPRARRACCGRQAARSPLLCRVAAPAPSHAVCLPQRPRPALRRAVGHERRLWHQRARRLGPAIQLLRGARQAASPAPEPRSAGRRPGAACLPACCRVARAARPGAAAIPAGPSPARRGPAPRPGRASGAGPLRALLPLTPPLRTPQNRSMWAWWTRASSTPTPTWPTTCGPTRERWRATAWTTTATVRRAVGRRGQCTAAAARAGGARPSIAVGPCRGPHPLPCAKPSTRRLRR